MNDVRPPTRTTIFDRFLAFVGEVQRQRALVERPLRSLQSAAPATDSAGDLPAFLLDAPLPMAEREQAAPSQNPAAVAAVDPEVILERLQAYIEADARSFARGGSDLMIAQFREAQYAMVALADDLFLHVVEWNGAEVWRTNHLEHRVFQSRLAGERIFDRMEALLQSGDRRLEQLASVYLSLLSLGFRGRYRGEAGEVRVQEYAARLFQMISGREPTLIGGWSGRVSTPLVPSAYSYTVMSDRSASLKGPPRWWMLLAGIVVLWLVAAETVRWTAASDVSGAAAMVLRVAGEQR